MRCSKAGKYLSPYVDGELGAREVVRLESHLAQCERCSRELGEIRLLRSLFSNAERFSAPPRLRASVMERVKGPSAKGFSLIPFFTRFAETVVVLLAITAGVMSGGLLINTLVPLHKGEQIVSALSLEAFGELPPGSLGRAYLAMTEERP
jgi:anti-sigma factor RsiW